MLFVTVYDWAHNDLQQLDSLDANLNSLKQKLVLYDIYFFRAIGLFYCI